MKEIYNTKIRIAVCDDEKSDREMILQMAEEVLQEEKINFVISGYESGRELLCKVHKGEVYQIYMLDMMMDELNGMELAAKLRERGDRAVIIFISSNRELAMLGYEVAAVRYLAKPLDRAKLREALLFGCRNCQDTKVMLLPTEKGESRIELEEIMYAETWNRGVRLRLKSGTMESKIRISDLLHMLPEQQFVYCHRQILVNLAYAKHIRYCELELKNGECLPVSKYRLQDLRRSFLKYLSV